MKHAAHLLLLLSLFLTAFTSTAFSAEPSAESSVGEARQALSDILDLWRDEQFEQLFARTIPSGNHGRDFFLERMVNSLRKPACCWEKLQELKAPYVSADRVILIARVGMELDGAGVAFFTRSFAMTRVAGMWKVPMSDILSLADATGYRAFPREILESPVP